MANPQPMDMASMVKNNQLFTKINELDDKFYKTIEEKKIEIKSINDVERVERFFNPILKELIKIIDEAQLQENSMKVMVKARVIIDFHGRFAEKYNLDIMQVVEKMGKNNLKLVTDSLRDIKKFT